MLGRKMYIGDFFENKVYRWLNNYSYIPANHMFFHTEDFGSLSTDETIESWH